MRDALKERIERTKADLEKAEVAYHNIVEPGDGIVASIAAGAGSVFRLESDLEELKELYKHVCAWKRLYDNYREC